MEKKRNLWVIPTDKPSKLWINNLLQGKLELNEEALPFNTAQHLYITSDEEIKEGIYTIDLRFNTIVKITTLNIEDCKIGFYDGSLKKIILTTDQDLIADGIQAIDDEFLEWFINNSNCKKVIVTNLYGDFNPIKYEYKIILPKEEPKQETLEEAAEKWVFETNSHKWSNNDDTAGDNYGSFINGAKSDAAKNYWFKQFNIK